VVVPPEVNTKAKRAVVGEFPGWSESKEGRPFVGASGQLLNDALKHVGLRREDMHVTNAALCQPPDRGQGNARGPDTALAVKAAKCCQPRLLAELEGKELILAVGGTALSSVVGRKTRILKARGFIWEGKFLRAVKYKKKELVSLRPTTRVYGSVHPAFVLRTPSWESVFITDVDRFARAARPISPGEVRILQHGNGDLKFLQQLGSVVGYDIETTKDSPTRALLLCVGISDGERTGVVVFAHGHAPNKSIYNDGGAAAVAAINRCLQTRTAVTHNGPGFDHIVSGRYGITIKKYEDTLIKHHVVAGHMPQRLDHCVSMFLDVEPWKILARDDEKGSIDPKRIQSEDLWYYNARDAQLQKLLNDELDHAA
jgi:DNA polymerase